MVNSIENINNALLTGDKIYLQQEQARRIVTQTLDDYAKAYNISEAEKNYLQGHAERFVQTLMRIPKASEQNMPCLDIGGYLLTPYWLARYFGYKVTVYNWDPQIEHGKTFEESITIDSVTVEYIRCNVNLDLTWPKQQYSFILFCETFEHLLEPIAAMAKLNATCTQGAHVLLTTPNSASITTLNELLKGLPPWNFRFFTPDAGGTRHIFEQTPYTLAELALSAGFDVEHFLTVALYEASLPEQRLALIKVLHLDEKLFGDTMMFTLKKVHDGLSDAQPPMLYDAGRFYNGPVHAYFSDKYYQKLDQIAAQQRITVGDEILLNKMEALERNNIAQFALLQEKYQTFEKSVVQFALLLEKYQTFEKNSVAHFALLQEKYQALQKDVIGQYALLQDAIHGPQKEKLRFRFKNYYKGRIKTWKNSIKKRPHLNKIRLKVKSVIDALKGRKQN